MEQTPNGTTHHGQLVAHYRKARHWSQGDLAEALRIDVRTVQRMEKQPQIKSLERRKLLVGLLGIPLTLIGLETEQKRPFSSPLLLNHDRMAFYEDEMAARWDLYHTGGTSSANRGLDAWLREIDAFAHDAQGSGWQTRAFALLTLSYQLQMCLSRDLLDFAQAQRAAKQAIHIAKELDDPELLASTLAHIGVTLLQQDKASAAIETFQGALKVIHYAGFPGLKSYILQAFSEAYAKNRQARDCWHSLEQAERALQQREQSQDHSKTRLFASSIPAQKGINAVLLQENYRAIALIDKSLLSYNPTFIRGRARLLAQQAEAFRGAEVLESSLAAAEEALTLARSVGSRKTIARVQELHATLLQSRWRKEPGIARLGALLSV